MADQPNNQKPPASPMILPFERGWKPRKACEPLDLLDQIEKGKAKVAAILARNAEIIAALRADAGDDERTMQVVERLEAVRSSLADIRCMMMGMSVSFGVAPSTEAPGKTAGRATARPADT